MSKYIFTIFIFTLTLIKFDSEASTWEKLYTKQGPDCFRNVHELPGGDFIATGYTNSLNSNDTDGLVIRLDSLGNRLWTYTYDGPSHANDGFYKGVPTSDGGFILCGFSTSFGGADDALFVKLDSVGNMQWVRNWGGNGFERARDIIQLSDGKFIAVGFTDSSTTVDCDAFILKLNVNGSVNWSRTFDSSIYDEAFSVQLLADGGFIMGGTGGDDFYLIRTDQNGNQIWSKQLGTAGIDVMKCLAIAPGGNGFALSGTTTGIGAGGEDAYLIKTDTNGNLLWSKYYGGPLDDGFQGINTTSDGGYIGIGTSRLGPWPDPNIWLFKLDASGNLTWQKYFGGDEHDHGYSASQTSDGGFIVGGHSRSFGPNIPPPDAMIIKTDSAGNVQQQLTFTKVINLVSPVSSDCGNAITQIVVDIVNYSDYTVANIPVTIEITGAINQTLTDTFPTAVLRNEVKTFALSTTVNMSAAGTYYFHCYTGNPHDVYPEHNDLDKTIIINTSSPSAPIPTNGTHCGPGSVVLTVSSSNQVLWYDSISGLIPIDTGLTFTTPYLNSGFTYFAQADAACPSILVPVVAEITTIPIPPLATGNSRCDSGSVSLFASSLNPVSWYDSANATIPVFIGSTFVTPSLDSSQQYFLASDSANCSSSRIAVNAIVNPLPSINLGPDTIYSSQTSLLLDAGSGFSNYLWSTSDTTQSYLAQASGNYCVTVTDTNTCVNSSCIFIDFTSGFNGYPQNHIALYPILVHGSISVEIASLTSPVNFYLYDLTGRILFSSSLLNIKSTIDLSSLPQGIYLAVLAGNTLSHSQKIVIE